MTVNDETDFLHKLLVTITKITNICKPFANHSVANVKL